MKSLRPQRSPRAGSAPLAGAGSAWEEQIVPGTKLPPLSRLRRRARAHLQRRDFRVPGATGSGSPLTSGSAIVFCFCGRLRCSMPGRRRSGTSSECPGGEERGASRGGGTRGCPGRGNEALPGAGERGAARGGGTKRCQGQESFDWSSGRLQPKSATLARPTLRLRGRRHHPCGAQKQPPLCRLPLTSCVRRGPGPCGRSDEQGGRGRVSGVADAWWSAECR